MITEEDLLQKIKDDLYLSGKKYILDNLPESQNALFIGKLRVPTKAHIKIIQDALKKFHSVVVCIVKARKEEKESIPFELQKQILEDIFGKKVIVITHSTGHLKSIMAKAPRRIKYLLAGSDRVDTYKEQLGWNKQIKVIETKRNMEDEDNISATKLIEAIKNNDKDTFKKLTHRSEWKYYDEIKKYINGDNK